MSALNIPFSLGNAEVGAAIPMDRWGFPHFSIQTETGTTPAAIEGTLARVNRGESPVWFTLGTPPAAGAAALLYEGNVEAIRITAGAGAVTGRVVQTGAV